MVAVIAIMTVATAAIGVLPSYAAIGILASVLLVLLRAVQGFSAGGEVATAAAFVVEHAPQGRRGLYSSWSTATLAVGVAAGLGTAALLAAILTPAELEAGWWRLSFLLALPLGLMGLRLRIRQADTPGFLAIAAAGLITQQPLRETWRYSRFRLLAGLAPAAAVSLVFNTFFIFLPTYLASSAGVPLARALGPAVIGLVVTAAAAPAAGRVSDAIGRRPVMLTGTALLAALSFPMYTLAFHGSAASLIAADTTIGLALGAVVLPAFLSEMFPTRLRATALSMTIGLAAALFGGTAPLVDLLLVQRTGVPASPAAYCTVAALLAVVAALAAGETVFAPLRQR